MVGYNWETRIHDDITLLSQSPDDEHICDGNITPYKGLRRTHLQENDMLGEYYDKSHTIVDKLSYSFCFWPWELCKPPLRQPPITV